MKKTLVTGGACFIDHVKDRDFIVNGVRWWHSDLISIEGLVTLDTQETVDKPKVGDESLRTPNREIASLRSCVRDSC